MTVHAAWREDLRLRLEDLIDEAAGAGLSAPKVLAAIVELAGEIGRDQKRDPDPAEDPDATMIHDPANDWPGAQR